jgi:hypothetical protein
MTPSFFMTADATGKTPAALLIGWFTGKSGATNVPRAALAAQPTLRLTFRSMRCEPLSKRGLTKLTIAEARRLWHTGPLKSYTVGDRLLFPPMNIFKKFLPLTCL